MASPIYVKAATGSTEERGESEIVETGISVIDASS